MTGADPCRERGREGLIVWVAVAFATGCGATAAIRDEAPEALAPVSFAASFLLLALAFLLRNSCDRTWWRGIWFLAALFVGTGHSQLERHRADEADPRLLGTAQRDLVSINGWIVDDPIGAPMQGATFSLRTLDPRPWSYDIEAPDLPARLRAGDLVRVRGWLVPDAAPRNPGGFDAAEWRRRRGIAGRVVVPDPLLVMPLEELLCNGGIPTAADETRAATTAGCVPLAARLRQSLVAGLRDSLRGRASPGALDMIVAMTLGARGESLPSIRATFATTGLSHFIVISGFHLTVLVGFALLIGRRLGARRRGRGAALIAVSLVFLLILESHVSVLRAGIAGAATGAALLLGRPWPSLSILALVTIVMLAADPLLIDAPAFQLSFAAVAALLVLAPQISPCLERLSDRLAIATLSPSRRAREHSPHMADGLRRAALARIAMRPTASAIAAWLVTAPITLTHFGHAAPWGIPGAIVLAPLAAFITIVGVPAAVLGAVAPPALVSIAAIPLACAGQLFLGSVEWIATLPGTAARWPPQPGWWCAAMVSLPFIVAGAHRSRRRTVTVASLAVFLSLASMPLWPVRCASPTVIALDLGAARSAIVRAGRETVLVDAGAVRSEAASARTIERALRACGITRIDAMILTERSFASMGAAAELLAAIRVDRVLVVESLSRASPRTIPGRALAAAEGAGAPIEVLRHGQRLVVGHGAHAAILTVSDDAATGAPPRLRIRLEDAGAPELLHAALDHGLGELSLPNRGARLWRLDSVRGWSAELLRPCGWMPCPTDHR